MLRMRSPRAVQAFLLALAAFLTALATSGSATGTASAEATLLPRSDGESAYSVATPPHTVHASIVNGKVRVSWTAGDPVQPPVTHYIVHAGPGSCPRIVPAGVRVATLPIVVGQRTVTPQVQAVNAYGLSSPAMAARALDVASLADPRYRAVQLLQLSDFHGAIGSTSTEAGAARLVTALQADRRAVRPTFTVSAGDNIGGSPMISAAFEDLPAILALNRMGLDVSTFGNHEHDRPLSHLRRMIDASEFQWTVANYSTLAPLQGRQRQVQAFTLVERAGVTVGFVGMNTEDTPAMVRPDRLAYAKGNQVAISASVRPVQRQIDAARRAGADLVVVLLHQGWEASRVGVAEGRLIELAKQLPGAAVVYGAHTHQTYASVVNDASVVQPSNSGRQYSRTQVCLDTRSKRSLGSWPSFVEAADLATVKPDLATQELVDRYQRLLAARMDEVVGTVDTVIERKPSPGGLISDTPLGNLITDAMREAYRTDFAFVNVGGVRDTLPASGYQSLAPGLRRPSVGSVGPYDVTLGDVLSSLPFSDDLATSVITGKQIWESLEAGQQDYGSNLFVSGLRFEIDPGAPIGSRVRGVVKDDGTAIPPDDTKYTMALPAFLLTSTAFPGLIGPATVQAPLVDVLLARLAADASAGRVTSARQPQTSSGR